MLLFHSCAVEWIRTTLPKRDRIYSPGRLSNCVATAYVRLVGFEPTTSGVESRCSIQTELQAHLYFVPLKGIEPSIPKATAHEPRARLELAYSRFADGRLTNSAI